jgi:hypothetical protein
MIKWMHFITGHEIGLLEGHHLVIICDIYETMLILFITSYFSPRRQNPWIKKLKYTL